MAFKKRSTRREYRSGPIVKDFGDMVGPLLVDAIMQWFGVRGFVSYGAVALACLVLLNFAARKN